MSLKTAIFLFIICLIVPVISPAGEKGKQPSSCTDKSAVSEEELDPQFNMLSIPAREVDDPYVFAVSYFNSTMNIILRDNVVSEYAYQDVPYYIYKSFMNADSKKNYWKECVKDIYSYETVY